MKSTVVSGILQLCSSHLTYPLCFHHLTNVLPPNIFYFVTFRFFFNDHHIFDSFTVNIVMQYTIEYIRIVKAFSQLCLCTIRGERVEKHIFILAPSLDICIINLNVIENHHLNVNHFDRPSRTSLSSITCFNDRESVRGCTIFHTSLDMFFLH